MLLISDQFVWADISEAVSRVTPESCRLYLASCELVWAQTLQEKQTGSHHQWSRRRSRSRRRRPLTSPPLPLAAVCPPQPVSRLSAHRRENQWFSRSLSSAGRWVQILSHQTPFKNHTFKGSVMTAGFLQAGSRLRSKFPGFWRFFAVRWVKQRWTEETTLWNCKIPEV